MTRALLALLIAAALAILAAALSLSGGDPVINSPPATPPVAAEAAELATRLPLSRSGPPAEATKDDPESSASSAPDWPLQQAFESAPDLYALALLLRPRADAGDGAAMWQLGKIFDTCELIAVKYGEHGAEFARQRIELAIGQLPNELARLRRKHFDRCIGFADHPEAMEDPLPWRAQAMDAGHPPAVLIGWIYSSIEPAIQDPDLELVTRQIESLHPDALSLAREVVHLDGLNFDRSTAEQLERMAWGLLACELGKACGPDSEAVMLHCLFDDCRDTGDLRSQMESTVDPFLFSEADRIARQLAEAITAGQLAESGLVRLQLPR